MTLHTENCKNIIHFANAIMTNRRKIKGEQNLRYNLTIWKKNDTFYILNDISEYFTLVQLMHSIGNMNHAISIVGHWIFDSNYKKHFFWQESLDIIFSPSIDEEKVATSDPYFMLLDTFGHQFILKKDKHDTVK